MPLLDGTIDRLLDKRHKDIQKYFKGIKNIKFELEESQYEILKGAKKVKYWKKEEQL